MTKLSDTQAIVLAAAAQRADGNLLLLPGSLRGGAAIKVVTALLVRDFAREAFSDLRTPADAALNTIWRNADDGRAVQLRITPAGLEAIGIDAGHDGALLDGSEVAAGGCRRSVRERDCPPTSPQRGGAGRTDSTDAAGSPTAVGAEGPLASRAGPLRGRTRAGTKQALLVDMLRRKEGATIAQVVEATGWQAHTVRGALAGALKKRLGLEVTSEMVDGKRVYRLPA